MEGSDASAHPSPRAHSSSSQPPADASTGVNASRRASSETVTPYVPKRSSSTGAVGTATSAFSAFAGAAGEPEAGSSPTVRRLSGYSGIITQQSSPLLGLSRATSSGDTMPARRSPLCHVT